MFEPGSRYFALEEATFTFADGRTVAYKRRRFLPQGRTLPRLAVVTVEAGDRLDLIAARTLGDPEQFWRICDVSAELRPGDLEQPGRRITVPLVVR